EDPEGYIHRAGRTGRAGGSGTAVSLVSGMERASLLSIAKRYAINLQERTLPGDEDVERIVSERIIALLEARLCSRDDLKAERMQRFLPLARSLSEESEETALLAMLLDDFYQETFHAPLVPPDSEDTPPAPRGGSQRHGPPSRDGRSRRPRDSNRRRR
ncbi:MAG: DEAD/DEAH box helicase, partial [Candidatus Aminicenantes bacterium]|nr:DEAD/DEAH box helicase [Candidatus Aminicenantes bacterium]